MQAATFNVKRNDALANNVAVWMTLGIAAIGAVMMTFTSSPSVKGASFLWLPAALQLCAGVWLGWKRGFLVGAIGPYLAGILAYGGFGLQDIVQNFIAGGLFNAMLPALLFWAMRIDPTFGAKSQGEVYSAVTRIIFLSILVLLSGFVSRLLNLPSPWGYLIPLLMLFLGSKVLLSNLTLKKADLTKGVAVAIFISLLSALVGAIGATLSGKPLLTTLVEPGIGWFFGDTVSAMLGLGMLAVFTKQVRKLGIEGDY